MTSVGDSSSAPSKWQIPIVFIGGGILWIVVTWVKWSLIRRRAKKYKMDNDKLETLIKFDSISGKTAAQALKAYHERRAAEDKAKFEKTEGRTLIEEIDERRRVKEEELKKADGSKATPGNSDRPKYSPEMFEDSGSLIYKEMMAKRKEEDKVKIRKRNSTAKGPSTQKASARDEF